MKLNSNHISILVLAVFVAFSMASTSARKVEQAPPPPTIKVAQYDYEPSVKEKAKSAQVVFLLVDPAYQDKFKYSSYKLFTDFSKAMSSDFNEALTQKGYTVRGPFEYYDQVVYSDKKESDLMLSVDIDFDLNDQNVKWNPVNYLSGSGRNARYVLSHYNISGFFVLSGKVNLIVSEPITREKLWAKSIPLKQVEIPITNYYQILENNYNSSLLKDPNVINPIVSALEQYYKTVFTTAWLNLDPNELTPLKKEVIEIREKKKY